MAKPESKIPGLPQSESFWETELLRVVPPLPIQARKLRHSKTCCGYQLNLSRRAGENTWKLCNTVVHEPREGQRKAREPVW